MDIALCLAFALLPYYIARWFDWDIYRTYIVCHFLFFTVIFPIAREVEFKSIKPPVPRRNPVTGQLFRSKRTRIVDTVKYCLGFFLFPYLWTKITPIPVSSSYIWWDFILLLIFCLDSGGMTINMRKSHCTVQTPKHYPIFPFIFGNK